MLSLKELKKEKVRRLASEDFAFFILEVFPYSFDNFITGDYLRQVANFMQGSQRTIRVGPRDHCKSLSLYAHFMWELLKARYDGRDRENHYFSYKNKMAVYHVGGAANENSIKRLIKRNPFFDEVTDEKKDAESIALFKWAGADNYVSLQASGLLTFVRGTHTRSVVYVDDPLQDEDPHKKLDPLKVRTINNRIKAAVFSMPQYDRGGQLHIVGTPQTSEDFFFDPDFTSQFSVRFDKAILDEKKQKVLFPEWRSYKWLREKRESLGERLFRQEYMCEPAHSLDSFLDAKRLSVCIDRQLPNSLEHLLGLSLGEDDELIAGLDVGKHRHPSHLSVVQVTPKPWIQRLSMWMDGWEYTRQLAFIWDLIEKCGLEVIYYDASRGEFESLRERGDLPSQMRPVNLTNRKKRFALAHSLARRIEKGQFRLVNDERQFRQMLVVDSDLVARETGEGHGDSFWSNACLMEHENITGATISFV